MSDSPTLQEFTGDSPSGRQLRDELSRETRHLLMETRRALEGFHSRLAIVEAEARQLPEMRRELDLMEKNQQEFALFCQDFRHWRSEIIGPIDAASKLDAATHGARMVVVGVFTLATCILAVAGVMQLISGAWSRFSQ